MTLPDDLAEAVDDTIQTQDAPPALMAAVQAVWRGYLRERGFLRRYRPLKVAPKGNRGSEVSQNHDLYRTGMKQ
jgi:hypothetical protein